MQWKERTAAENNKSWSDARRKVLMCGLLMMVGAGRHEMMGAPPPFPTITCTTCSLACRLRGQHPMATTPHC